MQTLNCSFARFQMEGLQMKTMKIRRPLDMLMPLMQRRNTWRTFHFYDRLKFTFIKMNFHILQTLKNYTIVAEIPPLALYSNSRGLYQTQEISKNYTNRQTYNKTQRIWNLSIKYCRWIFIHSFIINIIFRWMCHHQSWGSFLSTKHAWLVSCTFHILGG